MFISCSDQSGKIFKLNWQITFILTVSRLDDIEGLDFKIPEVDLDVPDIDYKVEEEIEVTGLDLWDGGLLTQLYQNP